MRNIQNIDLKEIINDIVKHHPSINKIYLFGSRAYATNSVSSDIDLLAFSDKEITSALVNEWLHREHPYADLFLYDDAGLALSASNGSKIRLRTEKYSSIEDQLDAILLWENGNFNGSFNQWTQETLTGFEPPMSIIPDYEEKPVNQITRILAKLKKDGLTPFFSGSSPKEIGQKVIEMLSTVFNPPSSWAKKGKSFNFETIVLKDEYDFQNLIHFVLRPVFPSIEREPFEIEYDGNKKMADFSICKNKIVLEAKWIDSTSKKEGVIKTLDGLKSFYFQNPNIECLLFLILYNAKVEIDVEKIEKDYSNEYSDKPILVRFFKNK